MRRLSLALAAVLTLSGAAAHAQTGALPTRSDLSLGQGEAFYMNVNNGVVRDVVVVDPNVADISIINERTLVVLGKRAGFTTVMAFDGKGRTLASRQVVVSQAGDAGVTVYRGATTANGYACADRCQRVTEDK